jgi:hypothetical protein
LSFSALEDGAVQNQAVLMQKLEEASAASSPNGDSPDSKPQPIQREAVYIRLLRFMVVVL